jgi:hypothetical protein
MTKLSKDANKSTLYFGKSLYVSHKDYAEQNQEKTVVLPRSLVGMASWETFRSSDMMKFEYIRFETTRAFADIDLKLPSATLEDFTKCRDQLFTALKKNASVSNFVYTDGSYHTAGGGKVSAHIIFQDDYIHKTSFKLKSEQGKKLIDKILRGVEDYEYYANGFDEGVYQNKHCFRLPHAKMKGKENTHIPMSNTTPSQYFVSFIPEDQVYTWNQEDDDADEEEKPKKKKKEYEEVPLASERILALVECLDPKKRANCAYSEWFKLACVLHNTLPREMGLQKFVEISMNSGYEQADEKECERLFTSLKGEHDKPLGERTLIRWAKEDNPFKASLVLKNEECYRYDLVFTPTTHKKNLIEFVGMLNSPIPVIVRDSMTKTVYIREDHRWVAYSKKTKSLGAYFNRLPISIAIPGKDELIPVIENLQWMEKNVWNYIETEIPELNMEEKFYTSTEHKICFSNGVYDIKTQSFTPWEQNTNVYSPIIISKPYVKTTLAQQLTARQIFESLHGKHQTESCLRRLARMIAGDVDKTTGLGLGSRNGGKSQEMKILEGCFEEYIQSFKGDHLLVHERQMGCERDPELILSWVQVIRHCRIAYSNEVEPKGRFLASAIIKLLQGGDKINLRGYYQVCQSAINHRFSILMLMNKQPPATSADVFSNIFSFDYPFTYYPPGTKEEMGDKWNDALCKEAVVGYADKVLRQQRDAIIDLILSSYTDKPVPIVALNQDGDIQGDDEKCDNIDQLFNTYICAHFKKADKNSYITNEQVAQFFEQHEQIASKTRKEALAKIQVIGGEYNKNIKQPNGKTIRGYKGITFIEKCPCLGEDENCP